MWLAAKAAGKGREQILWCAPTYDQCRIGMFELHRASGGIAEFRYGRMEVEFPGGGRVVFRSLDDPDNARGHTAHGVVVDEAALVQEVAWYEVLRPIISDTGGWAVLAGTPQGRNWFWREWEAARGAGDSMAWAIPTLGVEIREGELIRRPHPLENPYFPFAEALRMFETQPELVFRQEFLADFVDESGGVFRGVEAAATATPQYEAIPKHTYLAGADWARHKDFTCYAIIDATTSELVHLERFREVDYALQMDRLRNLYDRFLPQVIIAEANAMGGPIIEQLQRGDGGAPGLPVVPFTTTSESKRQAIEALALAIQQGHLLILADRVLLGELKAFQAERLPSGLLRYGALPGMTDDCVIALALAWSGVEGRARLVFPEFGEEHLVKGDFEVVREPNGVPSNSLSVGDWDAREDH
jgi:hypothetical protein